MSSRYTRINIVQAIEQTTYLCSLDFFKVVYVDVNQMLIFDVNIWRYNIWYMTFFKKCAITWLTSYLKE